MHKYFNDTFISSLNYTAVSIAALWSRGFGLGKDVKFLTGIFKLQAKRTKNLGHVIIVPAQFNARLAIVDVVQGRSMCVHVVYDVYALDSKIDIFPLTNHNSNHRSASEIL